MDLAGKRALVTGAAQGIGLAIGRRLLACGVHLTALDIQEEKLKEVYKEDKDVEILVADLNNSHETLKTLEKSNFFHLVVNNAGVRITLHLQEMDEETFNREMAINLKTVMKICQHSVNKLRAAGENGAIVNVGTIWTTLPNKGARVYDASKAGLVQFTRSLALEYGPDGIRANVVSPGLVDTDQAKSVLTNPTKMARFLGAPMKTKMCVPDDIASAVTFLLSEELASKITGVDLIVDNGLVLI